MTFEEILDQAIAMLQRRWRVTYRTLHRQFHLDAETLDDLLAELRYAPRGAILEEAEGVVWTGDTGAPSPLSPASLSAPLSDLQAMPTAPGAQPEESIMSTPANNVPTIMSTPANSVPTA